jgi:uncharacterized OsmC-like protein
MASNPRRIAEIRCKLVIPAGTLTGKDKQILEIAGKTCPVIQSLNTEIIKELTFEYQ